MEVMCSIWRQITQYAPDACRPESRSGIHENEEKHFQQVCSDVSQTLSRASCGQVPITGALAQACIRSFCIMGVRREEPQIAKL